MAIKPLNEHYSLHTPASIYNEEDLTALELAARTTAKVNEVVASQNDLRETTETRLENQDDAIDAARESMESTLERFEEQTIPDTVDESIQEQINAGTFAADIDRYAGNLTSRVDTLLGTVTQGTTTADAELIDIRVDHMGNSHKNAGTAFRKVTGLTDNAIQRLAYKITHTGVEGYQMIRVVDYSTTHGWYSHTEKTFKDTDGTGRTAMVPVIPGQEFMVTTIAGYQCAGVVFLDIDEEPVSAALTSSNWTEFKHQTVQAPLNACWMYVNNLDNANIEIFTNPTVMDDIARMETFNAAMQKHLLDISGKPYVTGYRSIGGSVVNGYIHCDNGELVDEAGWTTPHISLYDFPELFITGNCQYYVSLLTVYDEHGKLINHLVSSEGSGDLIEFNREPINLWEIIDTYPTARTIRVSSYTTKPVVEVAVRSAVDTTVTGNVLYGKKWAVCGDSFTAGDFTGYVDANGNTGNASDAYDPEMGMYKTYAWFIAKRNGMTIQKMGRSGGRMTNNGDSSTNGYFSFSVKQYKEVSSDADYITLAFGLNEIGLAADSRLGDPTSKDNTTLWGAYNTVLEYLIRHNPTVKIGIIIMDAWMNMEMRNALIDIAKYWGIPYLDMKEDPSVSLMLTSGGREDVNATAKDIRNAAMYVSTTNHHPNVRGHEYRATVIENFLRSL